MYPGEVVLKSLAAVGGKALPDVGRTGVLWQVPERKRRLPGTVRPRDYMAYRSLGHFFHLPILYHIPRRMRLYAVFALKTRALVYPHREANPPRVL